MLGPSGKGNWWAGVNLKHYTSDYVSSTIQLDSGGSTIGGVNPFSVRVAWLSLVHVVLDRVNKPLGSQ